MFAFKVTPDDGPEFEVTAGSRDVLVWEKTNKGKSFSGLADGLQMADLYKLAFIASKRQGLFEGVSKEFEESCEIVFAEDDVPDPTRPAP